jgi:hypothetical protein
MRAHNRKIRFSPWRYLNLLDLYSLETLAEWTGKAAVLISLCGLVAHATPPLIRGFAYLRTGCGVRLREAQMRNGADVSSNK